MAEDLNDILRREGRDAIRAKFDGAFAANRKTNGNGYDRDEGTRPQSPIKELVRNALARNARETQPPPPDNAAPDGFTADGLEIARPVQQLIKGILPQRGTVLLSGQSQAGKTFIATDMAVAVASGQEFFGKPVKRRGGVVIIAAEGMGGLQNRLIAAKVSRGLSKALPILWPHTIGNLLNERDLQAMLDKLTQAHLYFQQKFGVPLVLTIIDTITKACGMKDENANAEIVKVCKEVLDRIDAHTKALTAAVHHMGKDQEAGPRGGSAWTGNVDNVLATLAEREPNTGQCGNRSLFLSKNRDGVEGPLSGFELKFIELGTDDDGEPFGSCAIELTNENELPATGRKERHGAKPKKPNAAHEVFHAAFTDVAITDSVTRRVRKDGPQVSAVPLSLVRDEFFRRWTTGETDSRNANAAKRTAFNRAHKELINGNPYHTEADEGGKEWIW